MRMHISCSLHMDASASRLLAPGFRHLQAFAKHVTLPVAMA